MAKKLFRSNVQFIHRAPASSTRIPLLEIGATPWCAEQPPAYDTLPRTGMLYQANLMEIVEEGDHYRWLWRILFGCWGKRTPAWTVERVTDCWYSSGTSLKRHLDALFGQERSADEWRAVGLGRLIGGVHWITVASGLHDIVPYEGDWWVDGPGLVCRASGLYVAEAEMLDRDRGILDTVMTALRPVEVIVSSDDYYFD